MLLPLAQTSLVKIVMDKKEKPRIVCSTDQAQKNQHGDRRGP